MTKSEGSPDVSALLGHREWLGRLALHLCRGDDGAEDAVQETWMAALRAPPKSKDDLRPWLTRVLQNNLRRHARTATRRRRREEVAGSFDDPAVAPAAAALERLDLQRRLTELVSELEEPYRTTVVLRYFEEQSAAQIARQLGIPEGTVRWRTKEALDRLRARLDGGHGGDRKAWSVALLPLAREWAGGAQHPVLTTAAVGVTAAVLLTLGLLAVVKLPGAAEPASTGTGTGGPTRFALLAPPAGNGTGAEAVLEGMVFDPTGKPLPAAVVSARSPTLVGLGRMSYGTESPLPSAIALSGRNGGFKLTGLAPGRYVVAAAHGQYAGAWLRDLEVPRRARIELRLGDGGITLSGVVSDEGGGPIPGAAVMVQGRLLATFVALTSANGEYRVVLPDPAAGLVAAADGYAPVRMPGRVEATERRDLRLPPGARLTGRVTAAGEPVAGATVRLMPVAKGPRDHWERQVLSDGEGRFTFRDLPAVELRPFVRHGSLVNRARTVVSVPAGGEQTLDLTLEPGVTLRGRVLDGEKRPVPDSWVAMTETGPGSGTSAASGPLAEVPVDKEGRYQIQGSPPGAVELRVAAAGYTASPTLVTPGDRQVVDTDLMLEAQAGVVGVVYTASGAPAANAEVRGRSSPPGGRTLTAARGRTDAAGRFLLQGLGAGQVEVTTWLDEECALHGPFPLQVGERKSVTIKLTPGAQVAGHVRWEDGSPAVGLRVRGHGQELNPRPGQPLTHEILLDPARTDHRGAFTLGPFLPGLVRVAAFVPGEREMGTSLPRPNQAEVVVTAGQRAAGLTMVVSAGQQRIAGTALGPEGEPLPGATLIADRELPGASTSPSSTYARQTVSSGDGSFTIDGLSQGTFTVFARHPNLPDGRLAGVRAGTVDLKVTFPRSSQISGVVVTRRGVPVKDCFLTVAPTTTAPGAEYPRLDLKDPRGAFSFPRLASDTYDLTAVSADGLVAQARAISLAAGESRRVRLVAEPGATLIGRVVDDATGAAAAAVSVFTRLPGLRRSTDITDGSGAFTLRGIPAGPALKVSAHREGGTVDSGQLEVAVPALGQTVNVGTVRLRPRGSAPPPATQAASKR